MLSMIMPVASFQIQLNYMKNSGNFLDTATEIRYRLATKKSKNNLVRISFLIWIKL